MKEYVLEACVDSVESAMAAIEGGANRLELCANLVIGGTTPTLSLFKAIRQKSNIKIHVLIRPRFGDFCYSEDEFEIIREDIAQFRALGAEGVVIGVLKENGTLDGDRMHILIEDAQGMSITLHRAFDVCRDAYEALEVCKTLGIHTILTSGQENDCITGKVLIKELRKKAEGKVDLLVAGGVNSEVIQEMYDDTKITSYHMSGKEIIESKMIYRNEKVNMGIRGMSEYEIWQTNREKIREAFNVLNEIR